MPQYLTPGVFVEEVASGSAPIAGASTSTPGFIGFVDARVAARMPAQPGKVDTSVTETRTVQAQKLGDDGKPAWDANGKPVMEDVEQDVHPPLLYPLAPANKAILVTSWEQFRNSFGGFMAEVKALPADATDEQEAEFALRVPKVAATPTTAETAAMDKYLARPGFNGHLAHAVYGFFLNGGSRCWVVRTSTDIVNAPTSGSDGRSAAITAALNALSPIDEISLVAAPGVTDPALKKAIYQYCEGMGDRFAILDGMPSTTAKTPDDAAGAGLGTSNYAAVYYPWIEVDDPATGTRQLVAPSGHVAGVYARTDATRGVHKAPAAEVVRGATGLAKRVTRPEQDGLNPVGVNVIRDFDGNIKIWGARTLGGDANGEWKYLSVRRTFLFLRKSIDQGTQWAVFEPNNADLWAKIVRNVSAFLTNVWSSGALFGNTPQEAFFVRCDASLNTPDVRDLGQVITEIGVSVVRPAEFVIFRISQWSGPAK